MVSTLILIFFFYWNAVTITHHISRHTWRRILHLRCHMCPLGRRYWSRYANLMRLLSCWRWMAAKPQTGKVGHGGCSQSGEWKAGKHLSIKASAALKMMRLKTRGCLNERSPDRRGWKIDWIQIAHKSDFFFNVLLYGRGSCWGDTRKYLLGNICSLAKSESGIQKDNSLEKKEKEGASRQTAIQPDH